MKRFFEILPGALAWATLILMVVLSRKLPTAVSIFIILFDIYWLLKTVYLSLHLRYTFNLMNANLKIDWRSKLGEFGADWQRVHHLLILPMYKEPYEVVRDSVASLARTNYPKEKMIVVLATEARAGDGGRVVAEKIAREFGNSFAKFFVTVHPADLPGEIPGKGGNETWAATHARKRIDELGIRHEDVLVSVFDVDTQVPPEYFGRLTHAYLSAPNRERAIYQPIPLFTNNIYKTPSLARVVAFSATFWQMMQQSRPERLTSFSSQSIPLAAVEEIGFWQKDVVSEDSRIFWQGYLHYHGDFRVEPLFYPVSMDANMAPTFWGTMKNIYKQQRRWGWGAENIPYMLEGFRKDPLIPAAKKRYWTFNVIEGFHSWATNSIMIFALGWLPVVLGGNHFNHTLLAYGLPQITRYIITLSMIGIVSSAVLSIVLLPERSGGLRVRHYFIYFFEWAFMPITLIVFGALPGLEAQTRLLLGGKFRLGFWVTPKTRSEK